mmetsp:Transcript_24839/g.71252  ORF Transcript_24839/g.71252 Transcript_24839/m.71252 type:complete len:259 (-) Transcript_24839:2379-3155(-)
MRTTRTSGRLLRFDQGEIGKRLAKKQATEGSAPFRAAMEVVQKRRRQGIPKLVSAMPSEKWCVKSSILFSTLSMNKFVGGSRCRNQRLFVPCPTLGGSPMSRKQLHRRQESRRMPHGRSGLVPQATKKAPLCGIFFWANQVQAQPNKALAVKLFRSGLIQNEFNIRDQRSSRSAGKRQIWLLQVLIKILHQHFRKLSQLCQRLQQSRRIFLPRIIHKLRVSRQVSLQARVQASKLRRPKATQNRACKTAFHPLHYPHC